MKNLNLFILTLLGFLTVGLSPSAQAQLNPGDLAIVYFNGYVNPNADSVTILTLVPLAAGETFILTDQSVHNGGFETSGARASIYTVPAGGLAAYSLITYNSTSPPAGWAPYSATHGTAIMAAGNVDLDDFDGDQVILFRSGGGAEPASSPVFIFGLIYHPTGWTASIPGTNPAGFESIEPAGLSGANASLELTGSNGFGAGGGGHPDGVYTGPFTFSDQADALSKISNPSNWTTGGNLFTGPTTAVLAGSSAIHNSGSSPFSGPTVPSGPTAVCQDATVNLDASGNASISSIQVDGGSTGVSPLNSSVFPFSFKCIDYPGTTVTLTVTDGNGATASCTATVTVNDLIAPTPTCQDVTTNLDPNGSANVSINEIRASSPDNCSAANLAIVKAGSPPTTNISYDCSEINANNVVTLEVRDVAGNLGTCTASVTVLDTQSPTASCKAATVQLDNSGQASISPSDVVSSSSDNCPATTFAVSPNTFNCDDLGSSPVTVTLTITDASGNQGDCTADVTVTDPLSACCAAPTAVCQGVTVQLDGNGNAGIVASQVDNGSVAPCDLQSLQVAPTAFTCNDIGLNPVTLTITDNNNDSDQCTANISVEDNIAPDAKCQAATISLGNYPPYNQTVSVSNPDDLNVNTLHFGGLGSEYATGTIEVTAKGDIDGGNPNEFWIITDNYGNTYGNVGGFGTQCSTLYTPTFTLPASAIAAINSNGSITFTATDPGGITPAACSNDMLEIRLILSGSPSEAFLSSALIDAGSSDVCGIGDISVTSSQFDCSDIGANPVTLTVTDVNGNTAACTASVTLIDSESPIANCQAATVELDAQGGGSLAASDVDNNSNDACGSVSLSVNPDAFTCGDLGSNTVTLTVNDGNGNTASCTANVEVVDERAPSLSLIGGPIVICEGDPLVDPGATINDNCASGTVQGNTSGVDANKEGNYTITYDYTDPSGNTAAQITRAVTVENTPEQLAPQNCGSCNQIRFDFCEGDLQPDLELLLLDNDNYEAGVSFLWYADNGGSQGASIGNPVVNTNKNNRRFYWVSQLDGNCEGPARRVRVRVRKTSQIVFNLAPIGCVGGQVDLAAWVSDSRKIATGYDFYDTDPSGGGATPIGSVSATKGVVDNGQNLIINLSVGLQTYYVIALNNTGCPDTANSSIQVGPVALLDHVPDYTFNHGDLVNIPFSSPNATYIFWSDHATANNPDIGIIGQAGLGALAFTAQNTTVAPLTAKIRAIAYIGNCAGEFQDFLITVNPSPNTRVAEQFFHFEGMRLNASQIQLSWKIRYNFEIIDMEVERIGETGQWEKIGASAWLEGKEQYAFVDEQGENAQIYRLKLLLADGRAIWSQEVEIGNQHFGDESFSLYPNPNKGIFVVKANQPLATKWNYQIVDQLGRVVTSGQWNAEQTNFNLSAEPQGIYYLILQHEAARREVLKIVKE